MEDPRVEECELWLSQICRSQSLETLKVDTYRGIIKLQPEAGGIFDSLQHNSVLRDFSLGFPLDEDVSSNLTRMIRHNSALESIRLTVLSSEEQCYLDILDALKYNETLSIFENILAGAVGVSVDVQMKQHEMLTVTPGQVYSLGLDLDVEGKRKGDDSISSNWKEPKTPQRDNYGTKLVRGVICVGLLCIPSHDSRDGHIHAIWRASLMSPHK